MLALHIYLRIWETIEIHKKKDIQQTKYNKLKCYFILNIEPSNSYNEMMNFEEAIWVVHLLGSSLPNIKKGRPKINMRTEEMRKPVHQAPTHRGSAGVNCQLKIIQIQGIVKTSFARDRFYLSSCQTIVQEMTSNRNPIKS